MIYDVVWYVPARVADADKILRRLTLEEINDRMVPGDVLMSSPNVVLPHGQGVGRAVCRNFLGAPDVVPLGNTAYLQSICDTCVVADGLVGGILRADFLLSPEMEQAEECAEAREAALRASAPWTASQALSYLRATVVALIAGVVMLLRSTWTKRKYIKHLRSLQQLESEYEKVVACSLITRHNRKA